MKNLFDVAEVAAVKGRMALLTVDSQRRWGKMTAAQMVKHCALGTEMALGTHNPPRMFLGRVLGPVIKPMALKDEAPMRKNSPTVPSLVVKGDSDLEVEKIRLGWLLDRFAAGGAAACTKYPHPFFGELTADEWAALMYKHTDHHLRQFGV